MTLFEVSYQYFVVNIASDALLMFYASTRPMFSGCLSICAGAAPWLKHSSIGLLLPVFTFATFNNLFYVKIKFG